MNPHARVLVATDVTTDGNLVRKLLEEEFDNVTVSAVPDRHLADFERCQPEVLILAFETLAKAERYYLGLYRLSESVHTLPHRTLILCNKDDLKQVCELCKREQFDDYILFWPLVHDTPRLPMAVMHALRNMSLSREEGPTIRQLALQAQRIAELEKELTSYVAVGSERATAATTSIREAHRTIDAALEGFSSRLTGGEFNDFVEVKNAKGLKNEIDKIKSNDIDRSVRAVAAAVAPLDSWIESIDDILAPQLEAMRDLQETARQINLQILVVDDDLLQHKILEKIFSHSVYETIFASSGIDALRILRWRRPDVVLMDIQLPNMSGIEVLQKIKRIAHLQNVPVIMITGKSGRDVVVSSVRAGAEGFIVKPFEKLTLIKKIDSVLNKKTPSVKAPISD